MRQIVLTSVFSAADPRLIFLWLLSNWRIASVERRERYCRRINHWMGLSAFTVTRECVWVWVCWLWGQLVETNCWYVQKRCRKLVCLIRVPAALTNGTHFAYIAMITGKQMAAEWQQWLPTADWTRVSLSLIEGPQEKPRPCLSPCSCSTFSILRPAKMWLEMGEWRDRWGNIVSYLYSL